MLSKAQNLSLEDQRGPLNGSKMPLEIPDFLLNHHHNYQQQQQQQQHFASQYHNQYLNCHQIIAPRQHPLGQVSASQTTLPRSRSPIVIVYDNDDYETNNTPVAVRTYEAISDTDSPFIQRQQSQQQQQQYHTGQHDLSNKSQISYV